MKTKTRLNSKYLGSYKKYFYTYWSYFLLLFLAFAFLFHNDQSFNQDLGRHIKLGEIIWNTKSVPSTNLFSYTYPNFPFVNHHWLFGVLVYLGSVSIGLQAVLVIKFLILLLIVFFVLLLAYKTKSVLFFSVSFIFIHLFRGRTELRPEILSFVFTVVHLYILERFLKKDTKLIYLLPFISLIWVNSHIYFPVGLFLQGIFLADLLFKKYIQKSANDINKIITLAAVLGASILATFINPNYIKGALYPFNIFSNYGVPIAENRTIFALQEIRFINPDFGFYYIAASIVFISLYVSFFRTKFSLKNVALTLFGLALATQSIRGFPYLFLISLPYVLMNFHYLVSNTWIRIINILIVIFLLVEAFMYLNGSYYAMTYRTWVPKLVFTEDVKPAMDYVLEKQLPQPIFNNFNIGSYIFYRGYPEYKVSVDGRPEAYPAAYFTKEYLPVLEDYKKFKQLEKERGIKTVIFSILDQNPETILFFKAITHDPQWKIVFLDQFMIVLVKTEVQQQQKLHAIDLNKITVSEYKYSEYDAYTNLGTFLFNVGHFSQAKAFTEKALEINAHSPAANKIMTIILLDENPKDSKIKEYRYRAISPIYW
jgi:hypothetical protein